MSRNWWDFTGDADGLVEAATIHAKISSAVAQFTRCLSLTAPRLGLGETPWDDNWLKARVEAVLSDSDFDDFVLPLCRHFS